MSQPVSNNLQGKLYVKWKITCGFLLHVPVETDKYIIIKTWKSITKTCTVTDMKYTQTQYQVLIVKFHIYIASRWWKIRTYRDSLRVAVFLSLLTTGNEDPLHVYQSFLNCICTTCEGKGQGAPYMPCKHIQGAEVHCHSFTTFESPTFM